MSVREAARHILETIATYKDIYSGSGGCMASEGIYGMGGRRRRRVVRRRRRTGRGEGVVFIDEAQNTYDEPAPATLEGVGGRRRRRRVVRRRRGRGEGEGEGLEYMEGVGEGGYRRRRRGLGEVGGMRPKAASRVTQGKKLAKFNKLLQSGYSKTEAKAKAFGTGDLY